MLIRLQASGGTHADGRGTVLLRLQASGRTHADGRGTVLSRLQALVYDVLPPNTTTTNYAVGLENVS